MQYTLEEIKEGVSQLENVSFVKRRLAVPEKLYYSTLIWRLKEIEEKIPRIGRITFDFQQFEYGYAVFIFSLIDHKEQLFCCYDKDKPGLMIKHSVQDWGFLSQLEQELQSDDFLLHLFQRMDHVPSKKQLQNLVILSGNEGDLFIYPTCLRVVMKNYDYELIYPFHCDQMYVGKGEELSFRTLRKLEKMAFVDSKHRLEVLGMSKRQKIFSFENK